MARIEDSFLINTATGMDCPTVPKITPTHGADMKAHKDDLCKQTLTDESREAAIQRAAALVEYLHALAQLHWALIHGEGDYFTHRAAYDMAMADCNAARGIMERLIRGRSPAQVARLERERGLDLPACANE